MAESKTLFDDVKRELECSVCQEQFSKTKEPKILKCLHTFCKSCLETWLRQQDKKALKPGVLSCPNCRQITECPNSNIDSLPSNLFYKQMVDIVTAYSGQGEQDSASHCGNCDERKSLEFHCSDCNFFLCEDCAVGHKKWKVLSDHYVKEIRNFKLSDAQDYARKSSVCKLHNAELRFYCEQCVICIYYSFKIFPRFGLVETTRTIHHNQPLFTKFGKNLRHIQSMTSKVEPAAYYSTVDVKMTSKVEPAADYSTVDRKNLGTRL